MKKARWLVGAIVVAAALIPAAMAVAGSSDDQVEREAPITGSDLDSASSAALAYTGEGRVTGSEVGDEESYYEIEVTLDDGSQVDVQLDEAFHVVGADQDVEGD